ncbi:MAG: glycosyltransferase family 2 protein [Melioribacteraceae bacterium]|nr:glycosyltransferase family 2 protein [Melioribacteraceae bacterium]
MKKALPLYVESYLNKFGTINREVKTFTNKFYDYIVVMPALAEFQNIPKLIDSLRKNRSEILSKTLILVVVNNGENASNEVLDDNRKTIDLIISYALDEKCNLNLALIDASTAGNELKGKDVGVGLARKLGCDKALRLFNYESANKKLLIWLDADCTVAENYLSEIVSEFNNTNLEAAYVNFEHQFDATEIEKSAIVCYEIFLRYYVMGLIYAGSTYAFHSIGSTIICTTDVYVKVGGMNKKRAGEDFYFLEKLSKISTVGKIGNTTVYPSSRQSWRVPFGTGQRVNRFIEEKQDEYLLYNPASFIILKRWLELFNSEESSNPEVLIEKAGNIDNALVNFLTEQNFLENWKKILTNSKSPRQLFIQKKNWFDSFKTMKLIHYLRDNGYPSMNMFDALDMMFEELRVNHPNRGNQSIPKLEIQLEYLSILRKIA